MGGSVFRLPNSIPAASPWLYCLFAPVLPISPAQKQQHGRTQEQQ